MLCLKSCFKNDRFSRILRKNYWGKKSLISAPQCYPNFFLAGYNFCSLSRNINRRSKEQRFSALRQISSLFQSYYRCFSLCLPRIKIGHNNKSAEKSQNMSEISVQIPIFILIVIAKLSNRPIGNFFFCAAKYYLYLLTIELFVCCVRR